MELPALLRQLVGRSGGRRVVAEKLGVTKSAVGNWLDGTREPSIPRLRALLDACEATDAERLAILQSGTPGEPLATPQVGRDIRECAA